MHRVNETPGANPSLLWLVLLVPLLVFMYFQFDHANIKGMPIAGWKLIPLSLFATVLGLAGKRFASTGIGILCAGLGGAFGTMTPSAGPYGAITGLIIGGIIASLPVATKRRATISNDTDQTTS